MYRILDVRRSILTLLLSLSLFLTLWAVFSIQLEIIPLIPTCLTEEKANSINEVYLNLSYSFIAGYIFYLLTSVLPAFKKKKKVLPVIQKRIKEIGRSINDILLEFSRDTELKYDDYNNTEALLKSKDWTSIMLFQQKIRGVNISYVRYIKATGDIIKEKITSIIVKYKDYLTEEQIVILEELSDMSIFNTIDLISSLPGSGIADSGYKSLIKEFVEMQTKYFSLEKACGIEREKY